MNVRKGLFRLWVAVSVIWLIAVAVWATLDLPPKPEEAVYEAASRNAAKLRSLDCGSVPEFPKRSFSDEFLDPFDQTVENSRAFCQETAESLTRQMNNANAMIRHHENGPKFAAIAFGMFGLFPVLALLVLGTALLWAFRGFKP